MVRTTYVDAVCCYRLSSVVCLSLCLPVTIVSPAKTAEPIEMPFGTWTRAVPRKHALDGRARRRRLANTIEPSMCGDDAAFCQITLSTCSVRVFHSRLRPAIGVWLSSRWSFNSARPKYSELHNRRKYLVVKSIARWTLLAKITPIRFKANNTYYSERNFSVKFRSNTYVIVFLLVERHRFECEYVKMWRQYQTCTFDFSLCDVFSDVRTRNHALFV